MRAKSRYLLTPSTMPGTGETAAARLARTVPLADTPGAVYAARRGVPLEVALAAGLRFDADFGGRAAVVIPIRDRDNVLTAVHGRFLETRRGQNKMLTVGTLGGVMGFGAEWRAEPLIIVEGLFDALSMGVWGRASVATIGRWAMWLEAVAVERAVWLAFDATRPGEADALRVSRRMASPCVRRLRPPPRCKDWSTALVKRGRSHVHRWIEQQLEGPDD